MTALTDELFDVVSTLMAARYPAAALAFLAGSVVRGDNTATSDLDLVVVFEQVPNAYRESLIWNEWPIEAFVHDSETLRYFCEERCWRDGVPSLPAMVSEGIVVPGASDRSETLKAYANRLLAAGPKPWGEREIDDSRYAITDLVEDMRQPRSVYELHACVTRLYSLVADHYLRSRQLWSARGKSIPRRLDAVAPAFGAAFREAFRDVFESGDTDPVIRLCEEVLAPNGGWLFAGYAIHAPPNWRMTKSI